MQIFWKIRSFSKNTIIFISLNDPFRSSIVRCFFSKWHSFFTKKIRLFSKMSFVQKNYFHFQVKVVKMLPRFLPALLFRHFYWRSNRNILTGLNRNIYTLLSFYLYRNRNTLLLNKRNTLFLIKIFKCRLLCLFSNKIITIILFWSLMLFICL